MSENTVTADLTDTNLVLLAQQLNGLPEKLKLEALAILKESAETIAIHAQGLVKVRTGNLKSTIRVEQTGANTYTVKAGGATAPYAVIVEEKYPFISPAVELVKPSIEAKLKTVIQEKLNNVTK